MPRFVRPRLARVVVVALSAATAFLVLAAARPAHACGFGQAVDDDPFAQPPDGSDQVSRLRADAARLDARARQIDASAAFLDRWNGELLAHVRELRARASVSGELERARLSAAAADLSVQAARVRAAASEKRAQATQLRISARELRQRADRLAVTPPRKRPWRPVVAGGDVI